MERWFCNEWETILCAKLPLAAERLLVTAGPKEKDVAIEHKKLKGEGLTSTGFGLSSGDTESRVSAASANFMVPFAFGPFLTLAQAHQFGFVRSLAFLAAHILRFDIRLIPILSQSWRSLGVKKTNHLCLPFAAHILRFPLDMMN